MLWSVIQVLLLSQICLCRDGTIEESIRTKRVISYLQNPKASENDFSKYERKKVVETFHHIVKKILPPYPGNDTDYESVDTKSSHLRRLSLKSKHSNHHFDRANERKRRDVEIPPLFDADVDDNGSDGNVLSEIEGYSMKMVAENDIPPEESTESDQDSTEIDVPQVMHKKAVIPNAPSSEDFNSEGASTESFKTPDSNEFDWISTEDLKPLQSLNKQRGISKVIHPLKNKSPAGKKAVNHTGKHKPLRKPQYHPRSVNKLPKKYIIQFQGKPGEGKKIVEGDMDMLLSLLLPNGGKPTLPPTEVQKIKNDNDNSRVLFMWVFGALALLGIAFFLMALYLAFLGRAYFAGKGGQMPKEKPSTPESCRSTRSRKVQISSKQYSQPKDMNCLLGAFGNVLGKNPVPPNEALSKLYGSSKHYHEMKQKVMNRRS